MIRTSKLIRDTVAALFIAFLFLCSSANAFQSPLAPMQMPIGLNDTVSVETTPSFELPTSTNIQQTETAPTSEALTGSELNIDQLLSDQTSSLTTPESLPSSIRLAVLLGVLSLAPAIILMSTCYVRIIVVLTLLRQAFGVQQLPPTQVLTALSLFVTLLVMAPVWQQVKTEAIDPYTRAENPIAWQEAWDNGVAPMKEFMLKQIRIAKNEDSIAVFYQNLPQESASDSSELPTTLEEVPIKILLPAFLISELKVAFLLGFQIYLPFLILDLVVSSVTVSMGMVMLPPTMVSFPLKLILFVMVDGWNLVLGMLLQSFG
jgi:flagellar biosynthetic protein FliP